MINFEFTNKSIPDSSSVRGVAYNANTKELLVSLSHGDSYVYEDVPFEHYSDFVGSDSVGRAFRDIKTLYGPYSQKSNKIELTWVSDNRRPAPGVVPKNLTVAEGAVIRNTPPETRINLVNNYQSEAVDDDRLTYNVNFVDAEWGAEYSHSVVADSVTAAADVVRNFGGAIGRDFKISYVLVDFNEESA